MQSRLPYMCLLLSRPPFIYTNFGAVQLLGRQQHELLLSVCSRTRRAGHGGLAVSQTPTGTPDARARNLATTYGRTAWSPPGTPAGPFPLLGSTGVGCRGASGDHADPSQGLQAQHLPLGLHPLKRLKIKTSRSRPGSPHARTHRSSHFSPALSSQSLSEMSQIPAIYGIQERGWDPFHSDHKSLPTEARVRYYRLHQCETITTFN